jgi:plasmid maintenance system antidote protein VapI
MQPRGLSQNALARALNVPRERFRVTGDGEFVWGGKNI